MCSFLTILKKKKLEEEEKTGEEDPLKVEASAAIGTIFLKNILAKDGVFTKWPDKYTSDLILFT